jgi:hypothetical protein
VKRTRLRPVSAKRRARRGEDAVVRAAVFARDRVCRLWGEGRCFGPLTPHHRRKASQGGGYTLENLVALCAHHNEALEADAERADRARTMGLVVRRGDADYDLLGR